MKWLSTRQIPKNWYANTKELVFRRPHPTKLPDPFDGIAQERAAKLLGIIFTGKLSFEDHVDFVVTLCSQSVYLFKKICCEVRAFQHSSYIIWSLWPWYCSVLFTNSQPGEGTSPDSYKNAWMLFLNGLETLVFATQIIPLKKHTITTKVEIEHCGVK